MTLNDLDWLFRAKICFRAGLAAWRRATSESNCVKTNKDRHILSAAQISGMDSSNDIGWAAARSDQKINR